MSLPGSNPPAPVLLFVPPGMAQGFDSVDGLELREATCGEDVLPGDFPALLLLDSAAPDLTSTWNEEALRALPPGVVLLARGEEAQRLCAAAERIFLPLDRASGSGSGAVVRSALKQAVALRELEQARREMREVNKVGMALMSERDPNRLLGLILTQARRLTTSDAGSLYLVEEDAAGEKLLHFRLAQNDSLPTLPDPGFHLTIDTTSVAGYVAATGEVLLIEDAYDIPPDKPYTFNRAAFDDRFRYRAKSMLVVPMADHRDQIVGVLQLINRKKDPAATVRDEASADAHVIPFSPRDVELVRSLAGQAAVSIENGRLYQAIETLFEGFIRAAVTAIDQRDPTTSGHSVRVSALTCDLAAAAHGATEGPYRDLFFTPEEMRQLRYAGLLHDFGKVGVREEVLVKRNKLPPVLEARVMARLDYVEKALEAENEHLKAEYLLAHGPRGFEVKRQLLDRELATAKLRLEEYRRLLAEANRADLLPRDAAAVLDEIAGTLFTSPGGSEHPYLTAEELHYLRIPRGNLDQEERKQIESHVVHSFDYLTQIPWTDDLVRVAEIVQGHHEKLDGTGYPRGIRGDAIPVETRFMSVCDVFDALTAHDRPYRSAVPVDRALEILREEAAAGALDPDAVELFISSRVYERVLPTHRTQR